MSRPLAALALTILLPGCSNKPDGGGQPDTPKGGAPESKADASLTAEEFFKEFHADEKATRAKYNGKVVEIRAEVFGPHVAEPFNRLAVYGETHETLKVPVVREFFLDKPDAGKEKEVRLLARGQKVTVRGRGSDRPSELGLIDLRVVDSGPTTAIVTTLAELAKAVADPAGREKFRRHDVLVRVKVVAPLPKDGFEAATVADPDADGVRFQLRRPFPPTFRKEIEALKAGDVVTVLAAYGGPDPEDTRLQLDGARVVTSAPAGLSMPGGK